MLERAGQGTLAWVAGAVVFAALAVGLWYVADDGEKPLPPQILVTDVLAELSDRLDPATVIAQAPEAPVALGGMQPAPSRGYRRALVAHAPSELRFVVPAPDGAILRVGYGVDRGKKPPAQAAGIRFVATVDGEPAIDRVVNPFTARRDQRWFDERIVVPKNDKPVTITLTTAREGDGPVAGTPGWSRVQLVRETHLERQAPGDGRPNMLVLLVDTLRADHLGAWGADPSPSPVLDRLGAGGLVFDQAISQAPWTLPSVATLFTGLYPRWHGVVGRSWRHGTPPGAAPDADWAFLSDVLPTIATTANRAGISTIGVSANPLVSRENNLAHGFETFVELRPRKGGEEGWARADEVNEPFLEWVDRNAGRRFFAWLHYMEPHDPYEPAAGTRPPDPPDLNPEVRAGLVRNLAEAIRKGKRPPLSDVELRYLRALYDGAITAWDQALQRLLGALETRGVLQHTIVVVTADHGEEFQEHGLLGHRKQLYDESIHVPLVVAGPGIPTGRRAEQVQGIDLFPTVAARLGMAAPAGLPGRDVLAATLPADRRAWSETRYGAGPDGQDIELDSLRSPERKLIWAPSTDTRQLYELSTDPGERVDRWGDDPAGADFLRDLTERRDTAPPPPPVSGGDPALQEKLRNLGYLD
jgi:arylsulfatase A-like enzyme